MAESANHRPQMVGLLALSTSSKPALFACTKSHLYRVRLAPFGPKAQRALKRSLDFSPVTHYRDHFHPTFEGRLTPAAQDIQILAGQVRGFKRRYDVDVRAG
ncbi:hypothetical protein FDECE_18531, partial [Fusarium decemcellulare]